MIQLKGKATSVKIYSNQAEEKAIEMLKKLCDQPCMRQTQVRVMPDCHAANGVVVGVTVRNMTQLIPNLLGNDLGCGILVTRLKSTTSNFNQLDEVIAQMSTQPKEERQNRCRALPSLFRQLMATDPYFIVNQHKYLQDLGTLGNGNHFIELDEDEQGALYLLIHTGSRQFGKHITARYQHLAIERLDFHDRIHRPKHLAALPEDMSRQYIQALQAAQCYAVDNRRLIQEKIIEQMDWQVESSFDMMHNYLDQTQGIIRKGAVAAQRGDQLVIPLNMQEGALLCRGLGNADWNYSAPHGAGRIMSRTQAKKLLSLVAFEDAMAGIHTGTRLADLLDESPAAYKKSSDLLPLLKETVMVESALRPVYNFKLS